MNRALLELAIGFIKANTKDYLLVMRTEDNEFEFATSSRTWATGAALRTEGLLAEMDRVDGDPRA